jgi:hypothetical protein
LWMLGLRKWKITSMPPRLVDTRPWNLPNPIWRAMPPHGGGPWGKKKGNGTEAKTPQRGKSPNNSKARVLNPREIFWRRGLLSKRTNPREMLVGNLREHVSIVMKWAITPRIAPNPNWGMGLLRWLPSPPT